MIPPDLIAAAAFGHATARRNTSTFKEARAAAKEFQGKVLFNRDSGVEAKKVIRPPMTKADSIRETIFVLRCKDRWTQADYARMDQLHDELRAA